MAWFDFIWTDAFLAKIAEREIDLEEVRDVVEGASSFEQSRSTGLPIVRGYASSGRFLVVVFVFEDDITVRPVTAYIPQRD